MFQEQRLVEREAHLVEAVLEQLLKIGPGAIGVGNAKDRQNLLVDFEGLRRRQTSEARAIRSVGVAGGQVQTTE